VRNAQFLASAIAVALVMVVMFYVLTALPLLTNAPR